MSAPDVEIRFSGNHDRFAQAFARLHEVLDKEQLGAALRYNAELVFEEIVSNIIHYGVVDGGEPEVCVTLESRADSIVLTFEDDGIPFDPSSQPQPEDVPCKSLENAKLGGFGLVLVRRAASSVVYQRTVNGRNRLTVTFLRPAGAKQPTA